MNSKNPFLSRLLVFGVSVSTSVVLLSGCSKVKKAEDNMDKMAVTTESMSTTTDTMSSQMKDLYNITSATVTLLKQGDAATIRRESIKEMEETKSMSMKISSAAHFLAAMEFQLNIGIKSRETLVEEGIDEFFKVVKSYAPHPSQMKTRIPAISEDPGIENLQAIAVALHKVNSSQIVFKGTNESMMSLLTDALGYEVRRDLGIISDEDIPVWAKHALENRTILEYILQLRINFFLTMAFDTLTGVSKMGALDKALLASKADIPGKNLIEKIALKGIGILVQDKWDSLIPSLSRDEIDFASRVIEKGVIPTMTLMQQNGVRPTLDGVIVKALSNMNMPSKQEEPTAEELEVIQTKVDTLTAEGMTTLSENISSEELTLLRAKGHNESAEKLLGLLGKTMKTPGLQLSMPN